MESMRLVTALLVTLVCSTAEAREESILKQPDQHPDYLAELDVHGVVAYGGGPLAIGRYDLLGFGPGFQASIRVLKNGFIPSLNNSIAIGVGAELVFTTDGDVRLVTPVVLQWNFWVTQHWSVFGEPGVAIEFPMSTPRGAEPIYATPTLAVGGRYNFNDHFALVARVGFPMSTVGVSFFL
jgi:hypothetical protein